MIHHDPSDFDECHKHKDCIINGKIVCFQKKKTQQILYFGLFDLELSIKDTAEIFSKSILEHLKGENNFLFFNCNSDSTVKMLCHVK